MTDQATPALPWIVRAPASPYFMTEHGTAWTPIGQNDAIAWDELSPLRDRRDLHAVERHLRWLAAHGVTVLRLMLEYAQDDLFYVEQPAGIWNPVVVQMWDDLFALCARTGLRILLTPLDSFFTWIRWDSHPWNAANGGPCPSRTMLLTHPGARAAMKRRMEFATRRWGASGVIFAWDIYNEMHPAQGEGRAPKCFDAYIDDISPWLRALEISLHGRAHLQGVSVFGPELIWKPWIAAPIFRNRNLDFASSHFYEEGTIDDPADTVAPAIGAGRLVVEALAEIDDDRPFFESEHGPIHTFKDRGVTLPAAFDDEYFRHIQWAHLASGGAGGGMRWPNRDPHRLTQGMRLAQRAMSGFLGLIDWLSFRRRSISIEVEGCAVFACGDALQAVAWLLRRGPLSPDGRLALEMLPAILVVPGLADGLYRATPWNTARGNRRDADHRSIAGRPADPRCRTVRRRHRTRDQGVGQPVRTPIACRMNARFSGGMRCTAARPMPRTSRNARLSVLNSRSSPSVAASIARLSGRRSTW